MKFVSTKGGSELYSIHDICLLGLAPDGGLFMPCSLPRLPSEMLAAPELFELQELARQIALPFFHEAITEPDLAEIIDQVLSFPIPLVHIDGHVFSLELFHGPTMAFKDFGALFLARILSRLWAGESRELTVVVATSGDTGGAVANGFFGVPGVRVIILYPSGRVSALQEEQMTTLGGNITALEIKGSFDDCQQLAKAMFHDEALRAAIPMTSANSINFARLLPQTFYYIEAIRALRLGGFVPERMPLAVSVPSGNLGNLCAGVLAKKMGFGIDHFLLATNRNKAAVDFLESNVFTPRIPEQTSSNAMDVGNPSNLERLIGLYGSHAAMKEEITGSSWNETEVRDSIGRIYHQCNYVLDPHGAIGLLAAERFLKAEPDYTAVFLETAHPAKFPEIVEAQIGQKVSLPIRDNGPVKKDKKSILLPADLQSVRDAVLS